MTPIWLSTPYAMCESSTGPPLLRRSSRQPFIDRMRSYSSPVRQSNRGTLAPVYQTASIVRLSLSAEDGAKATATAKRSTSTPGSTGLLAAMTSLDVAHSCTSVTSSGIERFLGEWRLRPVYSCGPRRELGG